MRAFSQPQFQISNSITSWEDDLTGGEVCNQASPHQKEKASFPLRTTEKAAQCSIHIMFPWHDWVVVKRGDSFAGYFFG